MNNTRMNVKTVLFVICLIFLVTGCIREKQPDTITVETLARTPSSWDKNLLPKYPDGTPEVTILRITIPPKFELPIHKHPVINAGVLLKGSLTVITDDDRALHLTAGDSIVEVVDKWHYGRNDGDVPAEIIVFYAGIEGVPITIKQ